MARRTVLAAALALVALPQAARAQSDGDLRGEVDRLRAQVEELSAQIEALRALLPATPTPAPAQPPQGAVAAAAVAAPEPPRPAAAPPLVGIAFKGAPEFTTDTGWSFKPRGRFQLDAGYLFAPADRQAGQSDGRGVTTRIRRAYLGAQGTIPGGFTYVADFDLAGNTLSTTDLYLRYSKGKVAVTLGQQNTFQGLEQLESDLFLSFLERASFINAFGYERRVGASVSYSGKDLLVSAGLFSDDIKSLTVDGDKSWSADGRVVWMPRLGDTQLHIGGSLHYRDLDNFQAALGSQYRARPFLGSTDIRYIDTGVLTVNRESGAGIELAAKRGRFHFAAEGAWLVLDRPGPADPTFFGGYAEVGLFLTDDTRGYRAGVFDRTAPKVPMAQRGPGAIEANLRYDFLDLDDQGIVGGRQDAFAASLIWIPDAYLRFIGQYAHVVYSNPGAPPDFAADVIGLRAQTDF